MRTFIFHEGTLPREIKPDFEPSFFNTPSFGSLQDPSHWASYYLIQEEKKTAVAGIHFHISDRVARSPFCAPFGSVECSDSINPKQLYGFLEQVEQLLKAKNVSEIHIKNPPRAYSPEKISMLDVFLANLKYETTDSELTAVVPVGKEPFNSTIRHSEQLRLRQAHKADFTFRHLPLEKIDQVYEFIASCHAEKGYKLSIALSDLQKAVAHFSDRYLLFGVFQDDIMISASVSIRVRKNILYNFLVNHEKIHNSLSPTLLLMEGIYGYCMENSIGLFDLGTSSLEGHPNFPLLDFKLHIGGRPSSKLTFYKKIN